MTDPDNSTYTILYLSNDILGLCLTFLGTGHFAFIALVCTRFKSAYLDNVGDKKITSGASYTSSISCAQKYLEETRNATSKRRIARFWYNTARFGCVEVMAWAHRQGYSRVWTKVKKLPGRSFGMITCSKAAKYGQLDALQWLRQNHCQWDRTTCEAAASNGHLSVLQWARENGCEWDSRTCAAAARNGHLSVLQWARENGCVWSTFLANLPTRRRNT